MKCLASKLTMNFMSTKNLFFFVISDLRYEWKWIKLKKKKNSYHRWMDGCENCYVYIYTISILKWFDACVCKFHHSSFTCFFSLFFHFIFHHQFPAVKSIFSKHTLMQTKNTVSVNVKVFMCIVCVCMCLYFKPSQ